MTTPTPPPGDGSAEPGANPPAPGDFPPPPPAGSYPPPTPAGYYPPPPPVGYGQPAYGQPVSQPQTYLVWAILATLFCCLPFGIVSIVFAAQVSGKWAGGDYAGAQASSDNAKRWAIISAVSGLAVIAIYVVIVLIAAAGRVSS